MDAKTVRNSIKLKRRFVKDNHLPIEVLVEPYFTQRLETLDCVYDTVAKFDTFVKELEPFDNETEYFNFVVDMIHDMRYALIGNSKYIEHCEMYGNRRYGIVENRPHTTLYIEESNDRDFISIKINDFPFEVLRHYSPEIFRNAKSWEEFASWYTWAKDTNDGTYDRLSMTHLINSRRFKDLIFSTCGGKARTKYAMYLLDKLITHIEENLPIQLYSLKFNEILLSIPESGAGYSLNELRKVVTGCPDGIGDLVSIRMFHLLHMPDEFNWCRKYYNSDPTGKESIRDYEFQRVGGDFNQIVKMYHGEEVTEDDLVYATMFNGALPHMGRIDNPWV